MKTYRLRFIAESVSIILISASLQLSAQEYAPFKFDSKTEVYENIWKAGGELYMYDFPTKDEIKAPKGYKPVYLSLIHI